MRSSAEKIKKACLGKFINDEAYHLSSLRHAPEMSKIVHEIKKALAAGISPVKAEHSTSDVFLLKSRDEENIAVFKLDRYIHEYAAYRMDHEHYAGVPPTVITTLEHPLWEGKKTGSCQLYMDHHRVAVEMDSADYKKLPAQFIRRMALLDLRLVNGDRHTSNMLIKKDLELIPIDHECILQQDFGLNGLTWINWHQTSSPFSEEELSYLSRLDPEKDRRILIDELELEEARANCLYVSTAFLKCAAFRKIPIQKIGNFYKNPKNFNQKNPTVFKELLQNLEKFSSSNWTLFSFRVYEEVEKILDRYASRT